MKNRQGKGADYDLPEMKRFLDRFVDDNFGADRAKAFVEYYASKLTVGVSIVDKHGKPDRALLTNSMKNEMRDAAKDLKAEFESKFGVEIEQVSLSGNLVAFEKWDAVKANTWIAREILQIAKELASIG